MKTLNDFFSTCNHKETYRYIWEKSQLDFNEFLKSPYEFGHPLGGKIKGFQTDEQKIEIGRKLLGEAILIVNDYSECGIFLKDGKWDLVFVAEFMYVEFWSEIVTFLQS